MHGQDKRYHHPRIGINGRMDTLQAAILLAKLDIFPEEVNARESVGNNYTLLINEESQSKDMVNLKNETHKKLSDHGTFVVNPPYIEAHNTSVYAQYTIRTEHREEILDRLKQAAIPTAVHYPVPLNKQPALQTKEFELPVSEELSGKVMSLPMHPYLATHDQAYIVQQLLAPQSK